MAKTTKNQEIHCIYNMPNRIKYLELKFKSKCKMYSLKNTKHC